MLQFNFVKISAGYKGRYDSPVKGAVPYLRFELEMKNPSDFEIQPFRIIGDVLTSGSESSEQRYIGRAVWEGSSFFFLRAKDDRQVELGLSIESNMIHSIEELRAGKRPRFYLDLMTYLVVKGNSNSLRSSWPWGMALRVIEGGPDSIMFVSVPSVCMDRKSGSSMIEISIDDWEEILKQIGWQEFREKQDKLKKIIEDYEGKEKLK